MNHKLLQLLRSQQGHWITVEAIQKTLGLQPRVVLEHIAKLRQQGYKIETTPAYGFRLVSQNIQLTSELLEHDLQTTRIGRKILVYKSTNSTNDVAWQYASETSSDNDGLAIFAESQRSGRGRFARKWFAGIGSSVLCSVLLKNESPRIAQSLTLLAGLSVAEAIENVSTLKPAIKWPNDVIVNKRKLAGVMVESRTQNGGCDYVIGTGINCLQELDDFDPEIRDTAGSINQLTGQPVDRLSLAQQLMQRLDHWLKLVEQGKSKTLHDAWAKRCNDIGRRVTLITNGKSFTGRIIDVSVERGLLLQPDQGSIKIFDPATTTVNVISGN